MKLRTVHVASPVGPEQSRDQVAYVLGTLGWTGSWIDQWSGMARQGSEGASVVVGPLAGFCEVHWAVEVAPAGDLRVTIAQVRNSWVGKGGILDGKRAGKRLDELVAALQGLWPAPVAPAWAPAGTSADPGLPPWTPSAPPAAAHAHPGLPPGTPSAPPAGGHAHLGLPPGTPSAPPAGGHAHPGLPPGTPSAPPAGGHAHPGLPPRAPAGTSADPGPSPWAQDAPL